MLRNEEGLSLSFIISQLSLKIRNWNTISCIWGGGGGGGCNPKTEDYSNRTGQKALDRKNVDRKVSLFYVNQNEVRDKMVCWRGLLKLWWLLIEPVGQEIKWYAGVVYLNCGGCSLNP